MNWMDILTNKTLIYSFTIIVTLGLTVYLVLRYKLSKYQVMIFILLVLFWSAVAIVRAYRKAYAGGSLDSGGLAMNGILAANIAAAYGLISIFVRLPVFAFSDFFKSRKFFVALALVFIIISNILVIYDPSYMTLLISSYALGIGASLLSLFNVMFADTFTLPQALMSVSILSVAPLLAEFIVAPFQFAATASKPNDYAFMWIMSAVFAGIALVFLLFVKDNKSNQRNFTVAKFKSALTDKRFLVLCLMGVIVSFIRFANSGANIVAFAKTDYVAMHPLLIAYLDVLYSFFQLIAGVLVGIYLKKRIGVRNTLLLGLGLCLTYSVIAATSVNPVVLFTTYSLNGFGYGLSYNVLLGMAMQPFGKDMREITMGIYQTFFAIGIFYGDKIYALILSAFKQSFTDLQLYQSVFMFVGVICVIAMILSFLVFNKKNRAFMES
jgi:predicted MFS family arabinose efflux permease